MSKKCDQCGSKLPRSKRRFCSNKCKDRYHNLHNPRGMYAHLKHQNEIDDEYEIGGHPFESGDMGHGQW